MTAGQSVCTQLMGGLGNQMFQYAIARAIALRHQAAVCLDVSLLDGAQPEITTRKYGLGEFNVAVVDLDPSVVQRMAERRGVLGVLQRVRDRYGPVHSRRMIYETRQTFDARLLGAEPPVYLSGYWQSEQYFIDVESIIRNDFTLGRPLSRTAERYRNEMRMNSVSIHVRRGDYARNPAITKVHGLVPVDYYRAATARIGGDNPTAFIFSDDLAWARENLHLGVATVFVDLNGDGTEHDELQLMASCTHHVIGNSTFGWWGAWLGERPETSVVAPRKWFVDPAFKTDIVPQRWLRV